MLNNMILSNSKIADTRRTAIGFKTGDLARHDPRHSNGPNDHDRPDGQRLFECQAQEK